MVAFKPCHNGINCCSGGCLLEHDDQMGIPHNTVAQMAIEGITMASDLAEFDKDSLEQLVNNLR